MEIQSAALTFEPGAPVSSGATVQENTPAAAAAAAAAHARCRARALFTCDSVRYGCDDQSLELRLDSRLQVLHLQYHLLRLWRRDVTATAHGDCGWGQRSPCQ